MTARVLVVDDDATVASVVSAYLRDAGIESRMADDGDAAERIWREWHPDLVVLDLMLPGRPGLDVLRRLRADGDRTLVVILSARGDEDDRVVGLEVGADDYVVKPFSPRELVLRISGLLRRDQMSRGMAHRMPTVIEFGPLRVDTAAHEALLDGRRLALTSREYDLLVYLMTHPGEAFTKPELLRRVWGWDFGDNSTVMVHIRRLREKIEADPSDPKLVRTVRGTGYRFASRTEISQGEASAHEP